MLTELCQELHNFFLAHKEDDIYAGEYTILDGVLELNFLQAGQYYRIIGSTFNDGVHKYGDTEDVLTDEHFFGAIWAMAVPPAVVALSQEIEAWTAANAETLASPYASESFAGYSYSKKSGTDGELTWQTQFAAQLRPYRRIRAI